MKKLISKDPISKDNRFIRVIAVVVAIITLLSPLDLVPDLVPLAGFLDDLVAALYLLLELIRQFSPKK